MKNLLIIFILSVLVFSCGPSPKVFFQEVEVAVANAEKTVEEYDKTVLSALEMNENDSITHHTQQTLLKLVNEMKVIQEMPVPKKGDNLKMATESYIETLIDFVKVQSAYANYTDSISSDDAATLDNNSLQAIKAIEESRRKLNDYQRAYIKKMQNS